MPEQSEEKGNEDEAAVKTAPQLSPKLRKQIAVDGGDEPGSRQPKPKESAAAKPDASVETDSETPPDSSQTDNPMKESVDLDDTRTDEAVKDIVSYEGDVMLAVADSTAEARNREAGADEDEDEGGGRRWLSAIVWTLVIFVVIVAVVFFALLVTGGNVTGLKQVPGLSK